MRGLWNIWAVTLVFACLTLTGMVLSCQRNSNQSIRLSDFENHYGHAYYAEAEGSEQRTYFEESVGDMVKCLVKETGCTFTDEEAAAYLEYMLESNGYSVSIVAGQGQGETGILVYDKLQDDWALWEWGTSSLSDFSPASGSTDKWNDWNKPEIYENIYEVEEESTGDYDWWNTAQADKLEGFAQDPDFLPTPGFRIYNVEARVDEDISPEIVDGEPMSTVHLSYIISRFGEYEYSDETPEVQLKVYDDNRTLLKDSVPVGNLYRGSESLLLNEGSHHIELQISRLSTLAYGDCYLDVNPASYYEELVSCSYDEVETFILNDNTNTKEYDIDDYNCRNFSCDVARNANDQGLKAAFVAIGYYQPDSETIGHAVVCFDTTDQGLVFIEPQNDDRIELQFGSYYLGKKIVGISSGRVSGENCLVKNWPEMEEKIKLAFFASLNEDTAADAIVSYLWLSAEGEKTEDYVEDYIAALNTGGIVQVSGEGDEGQQYWNVLLQVGNPTEYEQGDETWSSSAWRIWDDGTVVPCDINALAIELAATSDTTES